MVTYGPLDVVLEFVACGAMLSISACLVMYWHPQLERVREWCKAGIAHPDRNRLLHLVGLTPIAWGLALGVYIRNVYLIGRMLAGMPKKHLGHKILSTLLNLYLSFVSLCGCIGLIVTIYYIYKYREDLKDVLMIIKFNPEARPRLPDLELQRLSPGDFALPNIEEDTGYRGATTSSDNRPIRRLSRDTDLNGADAHRSVGDASQPQLPRQNPTWNPSGRNAYGIEQEREARERAYRWVVMNGIEDEFVDNPPSPPRAEADDNSGHSSPNTVSEPPSLASDHGSDDEETFVEATPRAPRPTSYNLDGVDECQLSRCESCSDAHSCTIPHTRRAAVREPLTPTSPTRDYGRSAMWSRLSHNQSGVVRADGAQQPLLAGHDVWPTQSEDGSVAFTHNHTPCNASYDRARDLRKHVESMGRGRRRVEIKDRHWGGEFTAEVDRELGREAQKVCGEFKENRRSLAQSQQVLRASDRGQAISATLALHRGAPIPLGPSRQMICPRPGLIGPQGIPRPPSPSNRHPDPTLQNRTLLGGESTSPFSGSHSNTRPTRVMADPRMVQLGGTDGPPTVARVASPRLRLLIPASPSLVPGRTVALSTEVSRFRQWERADVEGWTPEHGYTRPHPFF